MDRRRQRFLCAFSPSAVPLRETVFHSSPPFEDLPFGPAEEESKALNVPPFFFLFLSWFSSVLCIGFDPHKAGE